MSKGTGNITVNDKEYKAYFPIMYLQNQVELPLKTLDVSSAFDIVINVQGGGPKGQAEAIKMAISRVLCEENPEYRPLLKKEGLLTRDSRSVERKKFGKRKARRSFQFSKR
jgi:small subunit ribosomal protein S9